MKKVFLSLAMIFAIGMTFANKNEVNNSICEDFAFYMVDLYYSYGFNDGFEAGALFESALISCEMASQQ